LLTESFGLADRARPPGVISEQLLKLGPENGIGHSLVEFLLQLEQCCEKRLRNESAPEPVEMTAGVR
jgi:hypothetical protein